MAEARNYYHWILSYVGPFVGAKAVEIGAGVGTFAANLLRETEVSQLTLMGAGGKPLPSVGKALLGRTTGDGGARIPEQCHSALGNGFAHLS
jgi:hypothetical protein